jgi:hypothetical protein
MEKNLEYIRRVFGDEEIYKYIRENEQLKCELSVLKFHHRFSELGDSRNEGVFLARDIQSDSDSDRLIGKRELSKRLNKSVRWIEMRCKDGCIPSIKIKGSVFFKWASVAKSLEALSKGGVVRRY